MTETCRGPECSPGPRFTLPEQPRRTEMREQIAREMVGGHVDGPAIHLLDELREDGVGGIATRQGVAHDGRRPERGELWA